MVPAREERLAGRSAQRCRMEAVVFETLSGETLGRRRRARTAERTRRGEAHVVEQDEENIRRSLGRPQLLNRRKLGVRVLGVKRNRAVIGPIRDRKNISLCVGPAELVPPFRLFASVDAISGLDSPASRPPRCDGRRHDGGFRNRRRAR